MFRPLVIKGQPTKAKSNTMGGSGLTYTLDNTTADKGSSDGVTWTAFKNISDATGTVNLNASGHLTGTAAAQTLNYSGYGSNVVVGLTGADAGTATNIDGGFTGVTPGPGKCTISIEYAIPAGGYEVNFQKMCCTTGRHTIQFGVGPLAYVGEGEFMDDDQKMSTKDSASGSVTWVGERSPIQ